MGRLLRLTVGGLLLAGGVVGLIVPVLQGWLMIGLGSVLLASEVPVFARLLERVERGFPRIAKALGPLRRRLARPGR